MDQRRSLLTDKFASYIMVNGDKEPSIALSQFIVNILYRQLTFPPKLEARLGPAV